MATVYIDMETASTVDLRVAGVHVYASDAHTVVWCVAWAVDQGPVAIWRPGKEAPPVELVRVIAAGAKIVAHNAAFERIVWNETLRRAFPSIPSIAIAATSCTFARALAYGLPGSLEAVAETLKSPFRKDTGGAKIMHSVSKIKSEPVDIFSSKIIARGLSSVKRQLLEAYCRQDVEVTRWLDGALPELSERERRVWELDQYINDTGVHVDLHAARGVSLFAEFEAERLDLEVAQLTGGAVRSVTANKAMVSWLSDNSGINSVARDSVRRALKREDLSPEAKAVLRMREEGAKTSLAKASSLLLATNTDSRLRGSYLYYGAHTGRWTARRVQVHNLPRTNLPPECVNDVLNRMADFAQFPKEEEAERIREILYLFYGNAPLDTLVKCLRGLFTAMPGHFLIGVDFSNIEGRVLAWMARETAKIDAFRAFDEGSGPDLYKLAYAKAFGIDPGAVTKDQRQIGKVMELACGFGGGKGAFNKMGAVYGVTLPDDQVQDMVTRWRHVHSKVKAFWYALQKAWVSALSSPGVTQKGARSVWMTYDANQDILRMKLPSGRELVYREPRVKGKAIFYTTYVKGQKYQEETHGGKLSENVTQAVARDVFADALLRVHDAGFKIVMHTHDEIVIELKSGDASRIAKTFMELARKEPQWAKGLPVAVSEPWIGSRYQH